MQESADEHDRFFETQRQDEEEHFASFVSMGNELRRICGIFRQKKEIMII